MAEKASKRREKKTPQGGKLYFTTSKKFLGNFCKESKSLENHYNNLIQ